MHSPPLNLLLAHALEQTLANPSASHRWHTLGTAYGGEPDAAQRAYALQQLESSIPRAGEVGFFYATFMAEFTREPSYSALAGQILQTLEPLDADRLMAFCVYEWGRRLMVASDRQSLTKALLFAQVPEAIQQIGSTLALPALPNRRVPSPGGQALQRIAIIAPYISNLNHPPTVLVLHHARLLADMGLQTHVFSAQEQRVDHMADYLGSQGKLHMDAPDLSVLRPHLANGVSLTLCDERFSVRRRCQDLLRSVVEFSPDVVLFIGFFSPLMQTVYAAYPTLGMCIHALQPMAPLDAWLCSDATHDQQAGTLWEPHIPPARGIYHPYRVALKPITQPTTREALGLPSDAVVLITAGARLNTEIEGAWAAQMLAFLQHHPAAVWLLVGGTATVPPSLGACEESKTVRFLPHQADLRSVLRCADIYVNPARLGGGFSVAEAMAEGLAVVALAQGDGGDKLGAQAAQTLDAYFDQLGTLVTHADARKTLGAALQLRFTDTLDLDRSGPALLAACNTACTQFAQRQGGFQAAE